MPPLFPACHRLQNQKHFLGYRLTIHSKWLTYSFKQLSHDFHPRHKIAKYPCVSLSQLSGIVSYLHSGSLSPVFVVYSTSPVDY